MDPDSTQSAQNESTESKLQSESSAKKVKNEKLRALLAGLDLAPDQTTDDLTKPSNRDSEILRDVPPHHGG